MKNLVSTSSETIRTIFPVVVTLLLISSSILTPSTTSIIGNDSFVYSGAETLTTTPYPPAEVTSTPAIVGDVTDPVAFEQNVGQFPDHVKFKIHGANSHAFLTSKGVGFVLEMRTESNHQNIRPDAITPSAVKGDQRIHKPEIWSVFLEYQGGNPSPEMEGFEKLSVIRNYIYGNNPEDWVMGSPHYGSVVVQEVWPGIDIKWYSNNNGLKFDFIVQPDANPDQITLEIDGSLETNILHNGSLEIRTPLSTIMKGAPYSYQESDNGRQVEVSSRYSMTTDKNVSFSIDKYDSGKVLVVDPLIYSTYLGGSSGDVSNGVAVDSLGNSYVTVTKIQDTGQLVYSTYLGGNGMDNANGIVVDSMGRSHVVGQTLSTNFPMQNPVQIEGDGIDWDVFIARFSPSGNSLEFSTYLGGISMDVGWDLAVDGEGSIYVTGMTDSINFPVTLFAFQRVYPGGDHHAFVSKLLPDVGRIEYSTFLGGSGFEQGRGISVDGGGNAYVVGETTSQSFPIKNAVQSTLAGSFDAFLTKLNPFGSDIIFSTYLGGSSTDFGEGIDVDGDGNAYSTGRTSSLDFPITPLAFQSSRPGNTAAFVTKIGPDGGSPLYSSYLGGSSSDNGQGISVDNSDTIHVTGATWSTDFPTHNAIQSSGGGSLPSVFVTKLPQFEIQFASGISSIDTRPDCAFKQTKCDASTPGFYNWDSGKDESEFDIHLAELDAHLNLLCAPTDDCDFWLKLAISMTGEVPVIDGQEVPVASLYWREHDGNWGPDGGIELRATVDENQATNTVSLEPPSEIIIPTSALAAAHPKVGFAWNVLSLKVEPHVNVWSPQQEKWDLFVSEAQLQLVGTPAIMVHGWTADSKRNDYEVHDGAWQTDFIGWIRDYSMENLGQDPWEFFGNSGLTWFSYHNKQDFRESANVDLRAAIARVQDTGEYDGPVNLIAHSLGGLVSRYFIENVEDQDSDTQVKKLATIATPHIGSKLADTYVRINDRPESSGTEQRDRFYIGNDNQNLRVVSGFFGTFSHWREWWRDSIQANRFHENPALMEPMMADFELLHQDGKNGNPILDRLNQEVGTANTDYFFLAAKHSGTFAQGDGIVSIESATLNGHLNVCKQIVVDNAGVMMAAHNEVLYLESARVPIYGYITGIDPCPFATQSLNDELAGFSSSTSNPAEERPFREIFPITDSPGNSTVVFRGEGTAPVTIQWELSEVNQAFFELSSLQGVLSGAMIELVAPDQRRATFGNNGIPEAQWLQSFGDDHMNMVGVHVQEPDDGLWTIEVSDIQAEDQFGMRGFIDSSYELDVQFKRPAVLLDPIVIEASFKDNQVPQPGAIVNGIVRNLEHGIDWNLDFVQQKSGNPPQENGLFHASFTPEFPGAHVLYVNGTSQGINRESEQGLPVLVHPDEARHRCIVSLAKHPTSALITESFSTNWVVECGINSIHP